MSPDRRPGLVLSRRSLIGGSVATFLLAACGQASETSKAVVQGITPVPVVIPISLSEAIKEVTPILREPNQNVSIKEDPLVPTLKTQLVIQQAIIDAYKEPTRVSPPTRTPVLVKPEVITPPTITPLPAKPVEAPKPVTVKPALPVPIVKPAGTNLDDEAKENALLKWLNSMNRPNQPDNKYDLDELKTGFFNNRGGKLQPISVQEIVGRFLNPNEEIDTTLEWVSKDIGSFTGSGTVSRHVRGLVEIKRGDNMSPSVAFLLTNTRGVEVTRFDITGSDMANGLEWRGGVRIGVTIRSKFTQVTTGVNNKPELKNPDGPFSTWRGEGAIMPLVKRGGVWGNPPDDPTRMPNFIDILAGMSSKSPLRIMEQGILGAMLSSDCPTNQVCTFAK